MLGIAGNGRFQALARFQAEAAHGTVKNGVFGNDVKARADIHFADGDYRGLQREVSRATIACRFITKAEATTAASTQASGIEPWPPRPRKVTFSKSAEAKEEPTLQEILPDGVPDQICIPKTLSTLSIAPC
jgi:hypothetical protein